MGQTTETRELKHVVVREHVRELLRGAAPGTPAPSERELVSQFGVARMTVRQALDALVVDGLLERVPGRGTFVAPPRARMIQVSSFSEGLARRGLMAQSQTLLARYEQAGPGVARALEIEPGMTVVHWKRLRRAGGQVIGLQDVYLDETLFPGFLDRPLPDSFYESLTARGMRPTWAEDSLNAELPTPEEQALLEMEAGQPVQRVSRRALWNDKVVEVSRSAYRSDRHTLYLQLGDFT
ncbi:GntR family transcriptional regulator [Nocardioides yefusunii]|uniref:GntR family transcriptional regulator n=1 Tax=Nocardioides yefusunii TaxID=2500546 RepID=A0ABW1QXH0_9ACTN|nr:GntR family transcriptional regulator [Nocardioides yefusunii]